MLLYYYSKSMTKICVKSVIILLSLQLKLIPLNKSAHHNSDSLQRVVVAREVSLPVSAQIQCWWIGTYNNMQMVPM